MVKKGQMKIQQMAFMLVAVFIFFIMVGLFFLNITLRDVGSDAANLERESAIESIETIANMPELNCDSKKSLCLDKDKLKILSQSNKSSYNEFWPVASIEVFTVYPKVQNLIDCPGLNCNYYNIHESNQEESNKFGTYVSICEKVRENGFVYDRCEIGKLVVGVRIR